MADDYAIIVGHHSGASLVPTDLGGQRPVARRDGTGVIETDATHECHKCGATLKELDDADLRVRMSRLCAPF